MIRALYTSASGMNSQQMNLDVIANNLANVNTSGFKKSKIEFQDLLYDMKKIQGAEAGDGQLDARGYSDWPRITPGFNKQSFHHWRLGANR